jgi:hypothetical protein
MERYCEICEGIRKFRIRSKSSTETLYRCSSCNDFQYKSKTPLGWLLTSGSIVIGIVGLAIGIHDEHRHN